MDSCCQYRLNGARVYLDNLEVGQVAQLYKVQRYRFVVGRAGLVVMVKIEGGSETVSLAEVLVMGVGGVTRVTGEFFEN